MKRVLPFALIAGVLLCSVIFAAFLNRSSKNNSTAATAASQPAPINHPTTGAEPAHVKGDEDSSITLEEFADFECPACAGFYPVMKTIEKEYGSRIKIIFRQFPLAQHVHAMPAARAAEAAGAQGKFWEMHDMLYENRESWTKAKDVSIVFDQFAQKLRLDLDRFRQDQKTELVRNRILLDHYRGRAMKLKSTPTLLLNGEELPFAQMKTIDDLKKVLDEALNKSRSQN